MTQDEYMENLQKKFERHFDIEKNITLFGETIDLHAKFQNISGRTFITKKDVIDRCENYEYCYIKKFNNVSEEEVADYGRFLRKTVDEGIEPGRDHMSTNITGVIVADGINDIARKAVEKYKYSKAYSFYLRGWCEVRLICITLDNNEIITNKSGRRIKKVYEIIS